MISPTAILDFGDGDTYFGAITMLGHLVNLTEPPLREDYHQLYTRLVDALPPGYVNVETLDISRLNFVSSVGYTMQSGPFYLGDVPCRIEQVEEMLVQANEGRVAVTFASHTTRINDAIEMQAIILPNLPAADLLRLFVRIWGHFGFTGPMPQTSVSGAPQQVRYWLGAWVA